MLSLKLVRGAENADSVRPSALVPLDQGRFVIGRDPSCDWPIMDKHLALSARHCEILRIEGRQVLRDVSTNGTFVNGSRERLPVDHVLRHGDRIAMGSYLIEVAVVPDVAAPTARPASPPPAAVAPAPRRGGDPAAMVGTDWEHASGAGPAGADVKTGLTRITKPSKEAREAMLEMAAAATRPDAVANGAQAADALREAARDNAAVREPVRRAPPGTTDVLLRLAGGLGIAPELLGNDPAVAADKVARLLRVAVLALHRQLGAQARQLREMGSRAPMTLAKSEAAKLRLAPGPEEAVAALLTAGDQAEAMLVRANSELFQHTQRLVLAFGAAGQRLGEQLAPDALERTAGAGDDAARLWKIYGSLWTALGIGVGKTWGEGFNEAVASYLAAAYDDPQLTDKAAADKAAAGQGR